VGQAWALQAIAVGNNDAPIEVSSLGELYADTGDSITLALLPDADGVIGRMWVRSRVDGSKPAWLVFAIKNATNMPVERWLAPLQDKKARIIAVTPSARPIPEYVDTNSTRAFRLVVPPAQTITFVAELSSSRDLPLYLWPLPAYDPTRSQR